MQKLHVPIMGLPRLSFSGLKTLSFGIKEVDNLFGGLKQGEFVVLHGSKMCHAFSELLCVRGQLPYGEGGLDSSVIFIDGGNVFDLYFISETTHALGLDPEEILRNIWISRAFTSYQLTVLVDEELPKILDQKNSKLVVISDIAAL